MSKVHDQPNVSEEEENQEESREPTPDRPSKRARISAPEQNAPKKRVKGRQGGLQGIMKMPIEVFMEIAPYVNPGDLITLIRTSKFFRAMLLDRSAAPIWQCALSNVPDLPPCPTGMSEPQYAALMFSKNCTTCGVQVITSKPDPYLRVRLCPACRDTELEERAPLFLLLSENLLPYTTLMKRNKNSFHKNPAYQLRVQVNEFERAKGEFIRNEDREGLAKWEQQQKATWDIQRKEGDELLKYIESTAASRSNELQDIRKERREQIHERLKTLGWEDKYLNFLWGSDSARKQWHNLVEAPKPLTERIWTNILPKLTLLLEENRSQVDERERKRREEERRDKAQDLLRKFRSNTDPYRSIVNALNEPSVSAGSTNSVKRRATLQAPFPSDRTVSEWDFLISLFKEENSLEAVEGLFNERQNTIGQKLLEWRTKVEDQLVKQYTSSFAEGANLALNTVLTVKGSMDATKDLSENARFLLRADTVFMESKEATCYTEVDQEHGPASMSIYFPIITPIRNYPCLFESTLAFDPDRDTKELEPYLRHPGKEAITKALLRELNMADVAHIELEQMGEVFVCGRCPRTDAMAWREMVDHYHARRRNWVGGRFVRSPFTTKYPVVFRNIHDLDPSMSTQPLVRIRATTYISSGPVARCTICRWVDCFEAYLFDSMEGMKGHMAEMHDTKEPVEGLHYMSESLYYGMLADPKACLYNKALWEEKWDDYHEARSAANEVPKA